MKLSTENLKWNIEITFGYAPALITFHMREILQGTPEPHCLLQPMCQEQISRCRKKKRGVEQLHMISSISY